MNAGHQTHAGPSHHAHMAAEFRKRFWATGDNIVAIPLAAGVLSASGVLLTPALGAVLMSASTVVVAVNARLLKLKRQKGEQS